MQYFLGLYTGLLLAFGIAAVLAVAVYENNSVAADESAVVSHE